MNREQLSPPNEAEVSIGEYSTGRVLPDQLNQIWPVFQSWLDSGPELWQDWHSRESIYLDLLYGRSQLWFVERSGTVVFLFMTKVAVYPMRNEVVVWWGMGERVENFAPMLDDLLNTYARYVQATEIVIEGRIGWVRKFAKFGFKPRLSVVSRPVPRERMQ